MIRVQKRWQNTMLDEPSQPSGVTRRLPRQTGVFDRKARCLSLLLLLAWKRLLVGTSVFAVVRTCLHFSTFKSVSTLNYFDACSLCFQLMKRCARTPNALLHTVLPSASSQTFYVPQEMRSAMDLYSQYLRSSAKCSSFDLRDQLFHNCA